MATRATLNTQILKLCGDSPHILAADVNTLLQTDNLEVLEAHSWTRRNSWTKITTLTPVDLTVGVTEGNSAITSASFTAAMDGAFIRIAGESDLYRLGTIVVGVSAILIDSQDTAIGYAGTTDADASAEVLKYIYRVSVNAEQVLRVGGGQGKIDEIDPGFFDNVDPEMSAQGDQPSVWSHMGRDSGDYLLIAIWPVPSSAFGLRVDFLRTSEMDDDADTTLYPSVLLKWKCAESAAAFLLARTGDQAWASLADRYSTNYGKALTEAKEHDLLKASTPSVIQLSGDTSSVGSDEFALNHDVGWRP